MPFCTNCGAKVDSAAAFCGNCGTAQPQSQAQSQSGPQRPPGDILDSISDRTACVLCYVPVLGVIPAIVVLASHKFRRNFRVRFNAFQSVYLFVTWLIVSSALPVLMFGFPGWGLEHALIAAMKFALFICWIYLLVKAANQEEVRLPVLGDLAARSTTEQL